MPAEERHSFGLAVAIILLATALRVLVLSNEYYPLYGDEAQYWLWGENLAYGYYSKPPLIAWVIRLGTEIFGDRAFGVRIFAPLLHAGTALLIFRLGESLWNRRTGFWASLTFIALPAVSISSLIMSTDVPLLFCWAAALLCLWRAMADGAGLRPWLLLGLWAGLGILAKYAMAMFFASALLYFIVADRRWLKRPGFWLAMMVAGLVVLPNILWNAANQFATFKHTGDNANLGGTLFHPAELAEFVAAQFGVFGPLLFAALIGLLVRPRWLIADRRRWFLAAFALPHLLMILAIALASRAHANWVATIYVSGTLLVSGWAFAGDGRRWAQILVVASLGLHTLVAGVAYGYHDLARLAGIALTRKTDPFRRLMGGPEIGRAVAQTLRTLPPDTVVMTDERMLYASLAFYVRPHPPMVVWNPDGKIDNHFELTTSILDHPNAPVLFISRNPASSALNAYRATTPLGLITVPIYPDYVREYRLSFLEGLNPESVAARPRR